MNELLIVNMETETVSARDLHEKLNIESNFTTWFKRMCEYGFEEQRDFFPKMEESTGGRPSTDYDVTMDMAKQICMIQRTPEGKACREYLLDLEKAWNTPEQVFARALKMADAVIAKKDKLIAEMKPKVEFFDAVAESKDAIEIGEVAKVLNIDGVGRNRLFNILRNRHVLMSNNQPCSLNIAQPISKKGIKYLWQSSERLLSCQGSLIVTIPAVHSAYRYLKVSHRIHFYKGSCYTA